MKKFFLAIWKFIVSIFMAPVNWIKNMFKKTGDKAAKKQKKPIRLIRKIRVSYIKTVRYVCGLKKYKIQTV